MIDCKYYLNIIFSSSSSSSLKSNSTSSSTTQWRQSSRTSSSLAYDPTSQKYLSSNGYKQASGTVGKLILDAFVDAPQFNITLLSRSSSGATFPAGFTVRKSDYSEADLVAAFKGQDAVVSVVGLAGFGDQKKFIDAAVSAGVKRFIPSEFSSNTLSPAVLQLLPVFGQKKEVLEYLKTKEASGLTWTAIWTALLFDWVRNHAPEVDVVLTAEN